MSTIEESDRGSVRRVRHAIVALLALAAGMAVFAADAAAGDLKVLKGGYRDPSTNSGSSYAYPLAGAVLEYDDSSSFGSPTDFPPTDAAGEAVATGLPSDRYYVRERTAPTGWSPISTLVWDGATRPYVGRADVRSSGTETAEVDDLRRFINTADNPPVPDTCDVGIRILLLLDRSGSTSGFNDDYRTAANTFVDTLAGTPTSLKISSFATNSTPGSTTFDLTAPGDVTAAKAEIQGIYPTNTSGSGATNWDKALQDAALADVDVIVFVTDGNPTVNQGDLDSGANESIRDIAYGIASANLAKYPQRDQSLAKQRIIGVGVGGGISVPNLKAVSGPIDGEDYVVSNDPAELAEVLAAVASAICSGTLTIEKETVPSSDTGMFDLEIDGTPVAGGPFGNGDSTGPQTLRTGTYTVSESGAMGTELGAYRSTVECVDDETGKAIASAKSTTVDVSIATDQEVTCTFTNTRLGTLEIQKDLPIMGDPGLFDLLLDGSALAEDVGDGGTTGPQSLEPATYTIAEAAGTGTTLDAYRTTVTCEDQKGVIIDAEPATKIDVDVADGQDVVCTFENTLRGTLTAQKALVPADDPGLFDLAIEDGDGVVASATDVGDGGSVGPVYLDGGTYVVAEAAGTGTDLAAYTSIVDCVSDVPNGTEKTIVPRQIAGPSQKVEIADGENVVCTFTNTRKGTLTVDKELDPVDDPGLFDLQIDDQTLATDVGDGGTTGPQIVDAGTYTVAELAGTDTDLAAYGTTVTCTDGVETLIDAAPVTSTEIAVADGQNVTCTFTNTRKGTLTVVKNLIPASDTGTFDLQIDGTTVAAAVGDGGTSTAQNVDAGTYTVGEAGANGTSLAGYVSSVTCTDGAETVVSATGTSAAVPVADGQNVVCTITNTADTGPITPAGTPDTVAPPVITDGPIILPPATIRGAARLRGPRGCVKPGTILTRVTGRNMARVVFLRNGRVVKRVKLNSTNAAKLRTVVLRTRIRPSDFRRYRVVARVTYVQGATPRSKTMTHTFRQCGRSSVTG